MPEFSARSKARLLSCEYDIQRLFNEVIKYRDCTIICGHRGKEGQDEAVRNGFSRVRWPGSKHNNKPSCAVDVMPYFACEPHIRWDDQLSTYNFIGFVQGVADMLVIEIRSGADWDMDDDFTDQNFMDLPHYELVG
jgi:peptidoglycan L-alanyl-D-glutamate endopeptidase CwlK